MKLFDPNNPNEKKKMIAAGVLGLGAIIILGYLFFGGKSTPTPSSTRPTATASPTPVRNPATAAQPPETASEDMTLFQPIVYNPNVPAVYGSGRNVFAYYEPPPPPVKPPAPPSPVPTPTLIASSLTPSSVYARTEAFPMQVMGDKFAPGVQIVVDGRALQTRFLSAQQLATTVTADLIFNPGSRQILVRNADGSLYSNSLNLIVTQPPAPNFNYVGLIGKPRFNDMAVLQDKNSKELHNVQRGDVVGGRFRVSSISAKEVVLVDTGLKVPPYKIAFTTETANSLSRPPPRRNVSDDEP
jgi:hypothetical protein